MFIDCDKVGGDQLVVFKCYDSLDGGVNFNWFYGLGSYVFLGVIIEFYDNGLLFLLILLDLLVQLLSYLFQLVELKMGILQMLVICVGVEIIYFLVGIYGLLCGIVGLDIKNQIDMMKEVCVVFDMVKYDKLLLGNNVVVIVLNVIEGFVMGFVDLLLEFIEGMLCIVVVFVVEEVNVLKDMGVKIGLLVDDMQYILFDLLMMSQMVCVYENGVFMGDLFKMVGIQMVVVIFVGGVILSVEVLVKLVKEGDIEGIFSVLFGLGLSGKMVVLQFKFVVFVMCVVIVEVKGVLIVVVVVVEVLNVSCKVMLKVVQDVYDVFKLLKI